MATKIIDKDKLTYEYFLSVTKEDCYIGNHDHRSLGSKIL